MEEVGKVQVLETQVAVPDHGRDRGRDLLEERLSWVMESHGRFGVVSCRTAILVIHMQCSSLEANVFGQEARFFLQCTKAEVADTESFDVREEVLGIVHAEELVMRKQDTIVSFPARKVHVVHSLDEPTEAVAAGSGTELGALSYMVEVAVVDGTIVELAALETVVVVVQRSDHSQP